MRRSPPPPKKVNQRQILKRKMDYRPFWLSLQFMAFIVHVILPRKDSEAFFFVVVVFFFLIMLMSFIFEIQSQDAERQSCGWVCSA